MFTDTHSHIHFTNEFPDIEAVLRRSLAADVTRQIIVGCTPKDSIQALGFVKSNDQLQLWSTLGVHPHNADECTDVVLERYRQLATTEEKIVALGELGLDYFRNLQPKNIQQKAFKAQLKLAKELNLAVVVHVRDAWDDALKILKEIGNTKVILHCFTGDLEIAQECWSRGYYTSFSGVVTYPKNDYLRDVASQAPENLYLIETDCPYLTPQVVRGKRNEPAFVVETAKELAMVRRMALEDVAAQTTANATRIFGLK